MSSAPVKLLRIADIKEMKAPEYLLQGLVPERGLVVICGPPKCGKSFTALDWSLSIASGQDWFGHQVKQGPVVYIYAETPAGLRSRVEAWCAARAAHPDDFLAYPARVKVADANARRQLIALIEAEGVKPAAIIIDTLAKCYSGVSENDATAMGEFVEACDKLRDHFDCAVLVLHHTARETKHARGSTALEGAVDAEFQMTKAPSGTIELVNSHQRDGAEHPKMWFKLVPSGESAVLALTSKIGGGVEKRKELTAKDKVKSALALYMPNGATAKQWHDAAIEKGVKERNFYTLRQELSGNGEVDQKGGVFLLALAPALAALAEKDVGQITEAQMRLVVEAGEQAA